MQRDFKGIWIPKEIWLNEELTIMEKVFFIEIDSLDNEDGCYASNNYFADFFKITPQRASQVINNLVKKKYITAKYEYNGLEIKKRVLNIFDRGIKFSKLGIKFSLKGYQEKFKDNNISNNTINNINKSFEKFWNLYDKKRNRKVCEKLWNKIKPELYDIIFKHIEEYKKVQPDKTYRKDPERYLKYECWDDEIIKSKQPEPKKQSDYITNIMTGKQ